MCLPTVTSSGVAAFHERRNAAKILPMLGTVTMNSFQEEQLIKTEELWLH